MVETIRKRVTVQSGGHLALQSSELYEGESVEVIIMVERTAGQTSSDRLEALRELRTQLNLDIAGAEKWAVEIREERAADCRSTIK